jgi:biofilm protein TabA
VKSICGEKAMICDMLSNWERYAALNRNFDKAFRFLVSCRKQIPSVGRYDIDGDTVYANVQHYETVSEDSKQWETHRRYIDIQYLADGKELLGYLNTQNETNQGIYQEKTDCQLISSKEGTFLCMGADMFAILYPGEFHKPGCIWDKARYVDKIVVKVAAE